MRWCRSLFRVCSSTLPQEYSFECDPLLREHGEKLLVPESNWLLLEYVLTFLYVFGMLTTGPVLEDGQNCNWHFFGYSYVDRYVIDCGFYGLYLPAYRMDYHMGKCEHITRSSIGNPNTSLFRCSNRLYDELWRINDELTWK